MTETPLDRAHAEMAAHPDDDTRRLTFYERLADNELFLLLEAEPEGNEITPIIFDTGEGRFALVFDREWRLSEFTGRTSPFAALSGRSVAALLAGHEIGLGVNLDVAPSSILIPAGALSWLHETLAVRPVEVSGTPKEVHPPSNLPEQLVRAIDAKLAGAPGLADMAILTRVIWEDGRHGHLLAFASAMAGAEDALARATSEALIFSGLDAGELDVAFLRADDPLVARLGAVGLRFDLPRHAEAQPVSAPGMDPELPPKLV